MKIKNILVAGIFALTALSGMTHAEVISSNSVMQAQHSFYNKQQIISMINREDVQSRMMSLGVDQQDAIARINAMTDSEIMQLNQQLEQGPAGGVVGAVLTVLAIIAILDLVGVTDVYPFIRPINS
ncbi:PA2779 family protein [Aliiglaciecola litoralis]|uniref:PA2779 family protein n=1 Tax=Aliiglaciecola litoralis TaxID=582857 RepID=A0ABN1LFF3_9ALTE